MPHLRRASPLLLLAVLASLSLAGLACAQWVNLSNTPTPTPTMPMIMCTPPACRPGEVFFCPGRCPGGCGTTCATATPTSTPLVTPAPAGLTPEAAPGAPCLIVTRTPPPSAPTLSADNPRRVDPHIALCASALALKTGDSVTLLGQAVDIGLPIFNVVARPPGAEDFQQWVAVTYADEIRSQADAGGPLEILSVRGEMNRVTLVLRARAAGQVEVAISATGEIHYGYPGPAMWGGGGSEPLIITVEK